MNSIPSPSVRPSKQKDSGFPVVILLDSSVYAMIRVGIATKSWDDERSATLMQAVNELNRQYKLFQYYFTKAGDIYLDACLVEKENEVDGERIYLVLSVLIDHLQSVYKELMKKSGSKNAKEAVASRTLDATASFYLLNRAPACCGNRHPWCRTVGLELERKDLHTAP